MIIHKPSTIQTLVGLIVILATLATIVWIGSGLINLLTAESDLLQAIITGIPAIIIAVVCFFIAKVQDRKAAEEAQLREKKAPVYEGILGVLYSAVRHSVERDEIDKKNIEKELFEVMEKLTLWAPPEVVQEYYEFKKNGRSMNPKNPYSVFDPVSNLILAIRKDLGHDDKNIGPEEILGLFVTDIDKYYPKKQQPEYNNIIS